MAASSICTAILDRTRRAGVVEGPREARQYSFASVCVNPYWVPLTLRANLAEARSGSAPWWLPPQPRRQHTEAKVGDSRTVRRAPGDRHGNQSQQHSAPDHKDGKINIRKSPSVAAPPAR